MPEFSLLELCDGGGCGCKASPSTLASLVPPTFPGGDHERLLVGNSTADDCAAWQVSDDLVCVSSADFFMPVVDDPHKFGEIAATNAISDIYAMGAQPTYALALAGMPVGRMPAKAAAEILAGGASACARAGIPVAGGHTIDSKEPIYGLSVNGVCKPDELCRNDTANKGDVLVLTKPLGVGILSAALRKGMLGQDGLDDMLKVTCSLNTPGRTLAEANLPTAMTDVTGFGLLGHALEMSRASGLGVRLNLDSLPLLRTAVDLCKNGVMTGGSERNLDSFGDQVDLSAADGWQRIMLSDPQTSGGLLVACHPEFLGAVLHVTRRAGFFHSCVVGYFDGPVQGRANVVVT